ncbi:sigma-70 family RNA polymerase sigma factor [Verrucomicrobiaceae bacterium N1E253]|uniref:Sigma-70 family RNA polymerase sigma factor n=1 Tax=Oceaniferula marina TaxID=2748318 RepID=A0A851GBQ5_9BACT|nr:sigma-70 family RNA polymerase sigma factor [Oceaniferula marina]NWK55033.1 sigma-70 family RNA polymerase sigma factor [Oceaniferula marina]
METPPQEYAQRITESQQKLFGYIYSLLGRHAQTWDVLQETNLVLWRKQHDFQAGTNFDAWAFSIARFQVLAYLRDQKRDPLDVMTPELVEAFAGEAEEEALQLDHRLDALQFCKSRLQEKSRHLLELYYEKNMRVKDIGICLSSNANATKQALLRVRRKLQQCIETRLENSSL